LLAFGSAAHAQEASIIGTAVDETRAVLAGVSVIATDQASGRQLSAMTNARGEYRLLNVPPGTYALQAEIAGFATVILLDIELLVGQNATIPLTMKLAQVTETLTVNAESPLVDTTSSQVAGNVDRRQMEELPLQGRNWMELSKLIKGITANDVTNTPGVSRDDDFQLNLDGQQITQKIAGSGFGQPKFSRESIAEFRSSPTCSTSRRADRPAFRCRRSRALGPTRWPAARTASFAATICSALIASRRTRRIPSPTGSCRIRTSRSALRWAGPS